MQNYSSSLYFRFLWNFFDGSNQPKTFSRNSASALEMGYFAFELKNFNKTHLEAIGFRMKKQEREEEEGKKILRRLIHALSEMMG